MTEDQLKMLVISLLSDYEEVRGDEVMAVARAVQSKLYLSIADEMDKDAQEFEKSPDPFKAGQFFALSRTADHYRDAANKLK
jgi:uncharacterized hydantoinase/oxoprolinase family protein